MSQLVDKLLAIHDSLIKADLAHAFGGAIALAYYTEEPRGTRDLDINIFADSSLASTALAGLPAAVIVTEQDVAAVETSGQARLWWGDTPVDVFLNNHPFHTEVASDVAWVPLAGRQIPVISCISLTVFKALFNRTRDWADIEAMAEADQDSIIRAAAVIAELLGADDPIYTRLTAISIG